MKHAYTTLLVALIVALALPSWAWGPEAQKAVVASAARLLSKEGAVSLSTLEKDIVRGASAPLTEVGKVIPGAETDPVNAVQSEMYLLQAVRGESIDPYLAYRLGMLGNLVAHATSPLIDAPPAVRDRYYADADQRFRRIYLPAAPLKRVDVPTYFSRVMSEANAHNRIIEKEYESKVGFEGTANSCFADDARRSVNAVADVWHTVFAGSVSTANMPEARLRDYIVSGMAFYIARGRMEETDAAYGRLTKLATLSLDLRKRIGDLFYDAGQLERAVQEYKYILNESPGQRDVAQRIGEYYMRMGDEALKQGGYEAASRAFESALEADPLNPDARGKQIEARNLLAQRISRQETAQKAVQAARDLENQAEREAMEARYATAISLLNQADTEYRKVSDEFVNEARAATAGRMSVESKIREYRAQVVANAAKLSGGDLRTELRLRARGAASEVTSRALSDFVSKEYAAEMQTLQAQLGRK